MKIEDIVKSGEALVAAIKHYKSRHMSAVRETEFDPILYAYLLGKFGNVTRQHYCRPPGCKKPQRIDFRIGGTNPAVIELVVRTNTSQTTLYGGQNISELRKLSRVGTTQAKHRILLLIDLCMDHIPQKNLQMTYRKAHLGRGRFDRRSVRVIYIHTDAKYDFCWKPYKNK